MNDQAKTAGQAAWWKQPRWWVFLAVIGFAVYFGIFNALRHLHLLTAHYDLGNMDQVLWQSLQGNWFHMMDPRSTELVVRSVYHADFLLLIYLPFYALWHNPMVMTILQAVFVASGAIPLYWFGKRWLSNRAAALVSFLYLLYPPLHWAVAFDVHAVVLAAPLLLWAAWAGTERRWWLFGIAAFLALLAKEEAGVTVALLGAYLAWKQKPRWVGGLTLVVGIAWTALMLGVVIPHSRTIPGHFALNYYEAFGTTPLGIVQGIVTQPGEVLRHFFNSDGLNYFSHLLLSVGFTPLAGIPLAFMAVPELAVNLLSNNKALQSIYFHYTSILIPSVMLGAVVGISRLLRWTGRLRGLRGLFILFLIGCQALALYRWSLLPFTRHHSDALKTFTPSGYEHSVRAIKRLVQPSDAVAVTNNLGPQFTQRNQVWAFPAALDRADAVVVLLGGDFEIKPKAEVTAVVEQMHSYPAWQLVLQDRDLYYFRAVR